MRAEWALLIGICGAAAFVYTVTSSGDEYVGEAATRARRMLSADSAGGDLDAKMRRFAEPMIRSVEKSREEKLRSGRQNWNDLGVVEANMRSGSHRGPNFNPAESAGGIANPPAANNNNLEAENRNSQPFAAHPNAQQLKNSQPDSAEANSVRHRFPSPRIHLPDSPNHPAKSNAVPKSSTKPKFITPTEIGDLNCTNLSREDVDMTFSYSANRIKYEDPKQEGDLPTDCDSIFQRVYFQLEDLYPEEKRFPIAFSRTVFRDYRMLEMELGASYAPQNSYCYALDSNSNKIFKSRIRALASCFSNVFVLEKEYALDSAGHNMNQAHLGCLRLLRKREWKYVIIQQNHDIALKSNQELIQIFKWFNGTNDVTTRLPIANRINPNVDWSFEALELFRDPSRNSIQYEGRPAALHIAMSYVQCSLSREFVNFILDELNIDAIAAKVDWDQYGVDELFWGSVNGEDAIGAPGGFTHKCLEKNVAIVELTRLHFWGAYSALTWLYGDTSCPTRLWRHNLCILGVEHFHILRKAPSLLGNKFYPSMDFGSLACWHQYMFEKTHEHRGTHRLDGEFYENLPQVRFNREKRLLGSAFDPNKFECEPGSRWETPADDSPVVPFVIAIVLGIAALLATLLFVSIIIRKVF